MPILAPAARTGDHSHDHAEHDHDRADSEPEDGNFLDGAHVFRPAQQQAKHSKRPNGDAEPDEGFGGYCSVLRMAGLFQNILHGA